MAYCSNCGNSLNTNEKFCTQCGTQIIDKKSTGYKQYKRFENFWETRVLPNGEFPKAIDILDELNFLKNKSRIMETKKTAAATRIIVAPDVRLYVYAIHKPLRLKKIAKRVEIITG